MKSTSYTIHRGVVRNAPALFHYVMPIVARASRAGAALSDATADLVAAEKRLAKAKTLRGWDSSMLARGESNVSAAEAALRAAKSERRNATARADEASKMHLVAFVPPYVPTKASRVYPALQTCTSPRRAAALRLRKRLAEVAASTEQLLAL